MRALTSAVAAIALVASSVAAAAPAPPAPAPVQQPQNPWVTLSMLTPVSATRLGSAGVAAQGQPVYQSEDDRWRFPPLPVIVIWLAVIAAAIWIATADDDGEFRVGDSPV